ncbi:MAG: serine/threonine protein kinase [Myxococcales bacterium]|nr:serine/threonine protein kinase [Myxococcales bacterium]
MSVTPRRYEIQEVLGRGGFGTVYRARVTSSGGFTRDVALKVLNREVQANVELASRLRDEARMLGMLRHRAIVKADGLVLLDDRWTVVMELVEGLDLRRVLEHTTVPPGAAFEIVAEVANALHVAHHTRNAAGEPLGLLHRDIKPSNILVTEHGAVKIVDFGGARGNFANREAKTRDTAYGSPGYVAPERLDLDERPAGDVFSLGMVFLELVGRVSGRDTQLKPSRHRRRIEQATQQARARGVPRDALNLVERMLAWAPEDRPTARDVERTARALRASSDDPWLAEWADATLPGIARPPPDRNHDFSADVLLESGDHLTDAGQGAHSTITTFYDSQPFSVQLEGPQPKARARGNRSAMESRGVPVDPSAPTLLREPSPARGRGVLGPAIAVFLLVFCGGLLALAAWVSAQ